MANKCSICGKFLSPSEGAKCSKCLTTFHRACAHGFDIKNSTKWACRECKTKATKSPVLVESPAEEQFRDAYTLTSSPSSLTEEIRLLREVMSSVRHEMLIFKQELVRLNTSMNDFNKRVETLEQRMTAVEQHTCTCNSDQDPGVMSAITQLKAELNEREQDSLLNDIQITGLPETKGENILHLVNLVSKKIGVELDGQDIVSAERKGFMRLVAENDERPRFRPITVRLARRSTRDQLLQAARVRRGIDTTGILEGIPHRIFVNEHLTRTNRLVFYKAREEGRRRNWRFVWTRGGCIFARRETGTSVHRIRSELDIDRIFGVDKVGMHN